jgi:beta-lactamase regulating signal transducer with metallopeptidase domain
VSIAACLLLYSFTVIVVGPPVLRLLTRGGQAPRFGVAVWLTAVASVLMTWAAAVVLVVVDVARHWNQRGGLIIVSCLTRLHAVVVGDAGLEPQIALLAAAVAVAAAAFIGVRLARTVSRLRVRAHEHAGAVRIVGHRTGHRDVVVLDAVKPAAYCVSGRPPAIVVTSAAVAALDDQQLGAVVAHERAHLAGYHPNVIAALRSLAMVFPRFPLMAVAPCEVARLLEMCADDAAARQHGSRALLSGLLALSGAAPAEALGAADIAVLSRAERLIVPSAVHARVRASAVLAGALAIIAAGPVMTAVLASSGALMCGL